MVFSIGDQKILIGIMRVKVIDREKIPYCTTDDWKNEEITMNKIFNYHLKKRVLTSINWKNLFIEWQIKKVVLLN
ncbi:hypothetical protein RhiirA5_447885 [Rhizophagus irregularis]|uniref:Uncharacterized protein n=1 Tax=Rhizophagus irregularis TaxID=588596 RepID=A0A2N0NAV8_9GLOM|nr:hypothetical protein RhiirA5_447885 [Rhizophagus irregularis]